MRVRFDSSPAKCCSSAATVQPNCRSNHQYVGDPHDAGRRAYATATLINSGKVLVTGGVDFSQNPIVTLASAELYDPGLDAFAPVRIDVQHAVRASRGAAGERRVLITGGVQSWFATVLNTAEIFDPVSSTFARRPECCRHESGTR